MNIYRHVRAAHFSPFPLPPGASDRSAPIGRLAESRERIRKARERKRQANSARSVAKAAAASASRKGDAASISHRGGGQVGEVVAEPGQEAATTTASERNESRPRNRFGRELTQREILLQAISRGRKD